MQPDFSKYPTMSSGRKTDFWFLNDIKEVKMLFTIIVTKDIGFYDGIKIKLYIRCNVRGYIQIFIKFVQDIRN